MTVWGGIAVAAAGFAGVSVGVGLVIARILGSISAGLNEMFEDEVWTSAPLTRALDLPIDDLSQRRASRTTHGSRT
jgi:hypothetical protein